RGAHADVAPLRLAQELVRVLVAKREPAAAALATSAVPTQERGGERASGERLAGPLGPGEDVRMMWTFRRAAEERHGGVLPGHLIEDRLHVTKTSEGRGRGDRPGITVRGDGRLAREPRDPARRGPNRTRSQDRGW